MELVVRPGKAVGALVLIVSCLTAAHLAGLFSRFVLRHDYVFGIVPLFDLDREHNIPSLYAAFSLLLCAGLLAVEAVAARQGGQKEYRHWGGMAVLFVLVAVDEQFALHERLILPLQSLLGATGVFHFAWVLPYTLLVLVVGIVYLQFFLHLRASTRRRFILAALVFLAGALGLEMIGGAYYEGIQGVVDLPYALLVTLEEVLEMAGVIIFIRALLADLSEAELHIRFPFSGQVKL